MPPKGERRKQQIIETAKQMFLEKGFQSTHIGQVCKKLDIARGTVYQYFRNKKEILYALLDDVRERVEDIFDPDDLNDFFGSNPSAESVLEFVTKRITSCVSAILNEPIVIKLIFKDIPGVDDEVNMHVQRAIGSIQRNVAAEVKELANRGIFRSDLDEDITAMMIIGGVMLVVYEYDLAKKDPLEESVIDSIAKNYLRGVVNQ